MNCLLEDAKNSPTALRCGGVEQVPHHHQGQGVFKKKNCTPFFFFTSDFGDCWDPGYGTPPVTVQQI
jgi:hypothetical protein